MKKEMYTFEEIAECLYKYFALSMLNKKCYTNISTYNGTSITIYVNFDTFGKEFEYSASFSGYKHSQETSDREFRRFLNLGIVKPYLKNIL